MLTKSLSSESNSTSMRKNLQKESLIMKSPGIIYRQCRKIRKKHLFKRLERSRRRLHENCAFGTILTFDRNGDTKYVRLCTFKKNHMELCTNPRECNAFAPLYSKEDVVSEFEKILDDPWKLRNAYPDLAAYQWVLDKPLDDVYRAPGLLATFLIWLINLLEWMVKKTETHKKPVEDDE